MTTMENAVSLLERLPAEDPRHGVVKRCVRELEQNDIGPFDWRARVDALVRDILRIVEDSLR